MPYTDDWSVAEGKTVKQVVMYSKRFVISLSDGIDIDVRSPVKDDEPVSVGIHVPEKETSA